MTNDRGRRLGYLLAVTACTLLLGFPSPSKAQQAATPPSNSDSKELRTAWFKQAKFGMFIHWGPYSVASVEASWPIMEPESKWNITEAEYVALYKQFNPVQFDPKAWVSLAKDAGMGYMVFTTKHHDGFCMFDTALTDYKITKTPYGKDVTAMLAQAAHEANMPLGFYYSPPDMHHPGFRDTSKPVKDTWHGDPTRPEWKTYLDYMDAQLRELLTEYGPVAVIWFDGLDHQEKYNGAQIVDLIHHIQPATLVNNRLGVPGDFATPEQFIPDHIPTKSAALKLQGTTKAQEAASPSLPDPADFQLWETCMTINSTWAYNKNDKQYKSVKELIQDLVNVAGKGGNLLLDVGPTPEGTIQPEFVERLQAMGKWLKVYGDSIYGTTYGPLQNLAFGKTTAKNNIVYVHVFDWPAEGVLDVPGFPARVAQVTVLGDRRKLRWRQNEEKLEIQVPPTAPDPVDSVLQVVTR
ncbi:MAG: alpha-L-fucosidase [Terriglobia bacterium]